MQKSAKMVIFGSLVFVAVQILLVLIGDQSVSVAPHLSTVVRSLAPCQEFLAKQGDSRLCSTAGDDGRHRCVHKCNFKLERENTDIKKGTS